MLKVPVIWTPCKYDSSLRIYCSLQNTFRNYAFSRLPLSSSFPKLFLPSVLEINLSFKYLLSPIFPSLKKIKKISKLLSITCTFLLLGTEGVNTQYDNIYMSGKSSSVSLHQIKYASKQIKRTEELNRQSRISSSCSKRRKKTCSLGW